MSGCLPVLFSPFLLCRIVPITFLALLVSVLNFYHFQSFSLFTMTGIRTCPKSDSCYHFPAPLTSFTPRIPIGVLIIVISIRLPFSCLLSNFRFLILLCESCFVPELTVRGAYCHFRNTIFQRVGSEGQADAYCHAHYAPHSRVGGAVRSS